MTPSSSAARHSKSRPNYYGLSTGPRFTIERLKQQGVEEVLDVQRLAVGMTVVKIRQRYPGHALKAGLALSGGYMGRFVVVVDEDIDAKNPQDVLWAIGTRCDPATTISVLNGTMASALDPRIPPDKKARNDYPASQAIILACKPYDWIDDFPKTNVASPELRAHIRDKWQDLF
jgi:UbiD family decarboxylase